MAISFFVVGDIGEAGNARRAVAQAMAQMLETGRVNAAFVLATGDNFYDCKTKKQFQDSFSILQEQMLNAMSLPWYFVLGNHDIKSDGAHLHVQEWHGSAQLEGTSHWEFRCPASFYSVADDWPRLCSSPSARSAWDASLLNIFVLNTNKQKGPLNFLGLWPGSLNATSSTWDDQKRWLQNQLHASSAAWNLVVGHHPIEFIPVSYKEHGIPGVKFLTTGFMKGHQASRIRGKGLRDVVVQGGADVYLCGHQHLMAHLVRKGEDRSPWRPVGPGSGSLEYWILGSSSKLEQDAEDFEENVEVIEGNSVADAAANAARTCDAALQGGDRPADAVSPVDDLAIHVGSDAVEDFEENVEVIEANSMADAAANNAGTRDAALQGGDRPADAVSPVDDLFIDARSDAFTRSMLHGQSDTMGQDSQPTKSLGVGLRPEQEASCSACIGIGKTAHDSWMGRRMNRLSEKMSQMWYAEQIGFAVVDVTNTELTVSFYGVSGSVGRPDIKLLHQSTKRK